MKRAKISAFPRSVEMSAMISDSVCCVLCATALRSRCDKAKNATATMVMTDSMISVMTRATADSEERLIERYG